MVATDAAVHRSVKSVSCQVSDCLSVFPTVVSVSLAVSKPNQSCYNSLTSHLEELTVCVRL